MNKYYLTENIYIENNKYYYNDKLINNNNWHIFLSCSVGKNYQLVSLNFK